MGRWAVGQDAGLRLYFSLVGKCFVRFQVAFVVYGGYLKNQTGHIDRFCMMEAVSQAPHIIEPFVILFGAKAGIEALAAFVPRGNRPFDLHAVVLLGFLF